ncbi:hypothetical protein VNO80_14766 [Phaseolus coccineus]|uniref:Uncharacterized protein n=1 Tax=Phaseolus coccineus TaxID=3886 RepID=A0AAN9MME4_PHACN
MHKFSSLALFGIGRCIKGPPRSNLWVPHRLSDKDRGKKAKETSLKHKTQNDCACGFCLFLCVSVCDCERERIYVLFLALATPKPLFSSLYCLKPLKLRYLLLLTA